MDRGPYSIATATSKTEIVSLRLPVPFSVNDLCRGRLFDRRAHVQTHPAGHAATQTYSRLHTDALPVIMQPLVSE